VGVAGMNGAYDLVSVYLEYLFTSIGTDGIDGNKFKLVDQINVNIAKPALAAFTLSSYSRYSKTPFNLSSAFIPSYHSLNCSGTDNYQTYCNVREEHLNITEAFNRSNISNVFLAKALSYSAFDKTN
jgi:hypothetical protein